MSCAPSVVPTVAVLGSDDLSLVLFDSCSCRLHYRHVDDVIAAINTVGLVPTDEHADLIGDSKRYNRELVKRTKSEAQSTPPADDDFKASRAGRGR